MTQGLLVVIVEVSGRCPATVPVKNNMQRIQNIPAFARIQITLKQVIAYKSI
jgi:hypothetical protein